LANHLESNWQTDSDKAKPIMRHTSPEAKQQQAILLSKHKKGIADILSSPKIREFSRLSSDFLRKNPIIETEAARIAEKTKALNEQLKLEQKKYASRLKLNLSKTKALIEELVGGKVKSGKLAERTPNLNVMDPSETKLFADHFVPKGKGYSFKEPEPPPDIEVFEPRYKGWAEWAWYTAVHNIDFQIFQLHTLHNYVTGETGGRLHFYMGAVDGKTTSFIGELGGEIYIRPSIWKKGRIKVLVFMKCNYAERVHNSDYHGVVWDIWGYGPAYLGRDSHFLILDAVLPWDPGGLQEIGRIEIPESYSSGDYVAFGFTPRYTLQKDTTLELCVGTGAFTETSGENFQFEVKERLSWTINGVIVQTGQ
jgi:hypothetical protein